MILMQDSMDYDSSYSNTEDGSDKDSSDGGSDANKHEMDRTPTEAHCRRTYDHQKRAGMFYLIYIMR
jgi:hypothetical protein